MVGGRGEREVGDIAEDTISIEVKGREETNGVVELPSSFVERSSVRSCQTLVRPIF